MVDIDRLLVQSGYTSGTPVITAERASQLESGNERGDVKYLSTSSLLRAVPLLAWVGFGRRPTEGRTVDARTNQVQGSR
jgi:hypothetical protein